MDTLDELFEEFRINVRRADLFDAKTPSHGNLDFSKIEGMMWGLAIGDALGAPTESMIPSERRSEYGEIRDYVAEPVGSDDTQLAFWTLEQMLDDGGLNPERLGERFSREEIVGIGSTVSRFVRNYLSGMPWFECGPTDTASNGSLMRIAPMAIPHLRTGGPAVWRETAVSAMLTHNSSGPIASCLAFVRMLWELLDMKEPPDPNWWLETYVENARELEIESYSPRDGAYLDFQGPIWRFVAEKVQDAFTQDMSVLAACGLWYSGAYLLETMPSVIYILMKHGDDPEEAIVRAATDTKDNDTIAAIVGAAVGALHGREALPERWRRDLLGRVSPYSQDGEIQGLLDRARDHWYDG